MTIHDVSSMPSTAKSYLYYFCMNAVLTTLLESESTPVESLGLECDVDEVSGGRGGIRNLNMLPSTNLKYM